MHSIDLRMSETDITNLREHCDASFRGRNRKETGAIGILGECKTGKKHEFLLMKLLLPGPGDLKVAEVGEVVFDASFIRRAHLEMRAEKLAGLVFFHTHPMSDTDVAFSRYDNAEEPLLVENLQELEPSTQVLSVVFGKSSQCGRLWLNRTQLVPLRHMISVGEELIYLPLNGLPPSEPPSPAAIFDRGMALTGKGALGRMADMTFVVVGASGTGSIQCELLIRAGAKKIIIVDDDGVKDINLNRILHSAVADADPSIPKALVLKRELDKLGFDCEVEAIVGTILDQEVLARLREADIIFGCIDKALPRELLGKFCFRYLIPYIDVGTEIGGDEHSIVSVDARVTYIAPGRHCLQCVGIVTGRQLHFESVSSGERERIQNQGYSDDLVMTQPAVMDLNMRAASSGMMWMRHLLQPFLMVPMPVSILENVVTTSIRRIEVPNKPNSHCPICQKNRTAGYGDCAPFLGFTREQVSLMTSNLTLPSQRQPAK